MPICHRRVELFCLFVACSLFVVYLFHAHPWKLQCYHVVLVGYVLAYPKFYANCQYLWKQFSYFVNFLHVVICIMWDICWSYPFWAGIVRHRFSVNQVVRCRKLKKLSNYMKYQVDFLLPLKLQKLSFYFGLWFQNTIGQSVFRIFYFWLVWLVNLITGGPLLHCTCFCIKPLFTFLPNFTKCIPKFSNNLISSGC